MKSTDWDKIAPQYFEHIESPFMKGVKNPVYGLIRKAGDLSNKSVLELGCGTGTLVPYLAKNFKHVVATDISKGMIKVAEENNQQYDNVEFKVMDMAQISRLREKFDVIVAVNSILMPNIEKVNKILKKTHKLLKKGGIFVAVMPSFDSLIYHALITYDKEYEDRNSKIKARRRTNKLINARHHDFCYAFFDVDGKQKHYYGFELEYRLKLAGFKKFKIGKVCYPWDSVDKDFKPHRFMDPEIYQNLWDWTVIAQK